MFDLAEGGCVRIHAVLAEKHRFLRSPTVGIEDMFFTLTDEGRAAIDPSILNNTLKAYEQEILDYIHVTEQAAVNYGQPPSHVFKDLVSRTEFLKPIETSLVERGLFQPGSTKINRRLLSLSTLFAAFVPLFVVWGFVAQNTWLVLLGVVHIAPAASLAVFGFTGRGILGRRTREGVVLRRRVEAYIQALKAGIEEQNEAPPCGNRYH